MGRSVGMPARRAGALLSHAGIAIVGLVIVAAAAGRQEASATLVDGQALELGAYRVQLEGISRETRDDRSIVQANVQIIGPGLDQRGTPALSMLGASTQALATPSIVTGPTTDVYIVLLNVDPVAGTVSLRLTIQPFMSWLWVGGLLVAGGGVAALGPRLARRSAPAATREPDSVPAEAAT
jgi:cytochrome c-type biogenesis protein CcmF